MYLLFILRNILAKKPSSFFIHLLNSIYVEGSFQYGLI
jgi:hypothetical protein